MKKLILLSVFSLSYIFLSAQADPNSYLNATGENSQALDPGTEFICTANSDYGQNPQIVQALTSDTYYPYKVYDNFSGLSGGNITTVDWWGLLLVDGFFSTCSEFPKNFEITFYADNAGTVGSVLGTFNVSATGNATTETFAGFPVYKFSADLISPIAMSEGWISIQGNPTGSCIFLWVDSPDGDQISYQDALIKPNDLAFCLYTAEPIPISNWALGIGLLLISGFIVIRFRKKIMA